MPVNNAAYTCLSCDHYRAEGPLQDPRCSLGRSEWFPDGAYYCAADLYAPGSDEGEKDADG